MKKLLSALFVTALLFTACEGDQGPPGPPGEPGDGLLGYTFERTVNFNYLEDDNLYEAFIEIPESVNTPAPEQDAVLVYLLEIQQDENGDDLDTWSLIPQNFFLEEGTIQYVYNHTYFDVQILIDGNFDLINLDPVFTEGQTFRIVVLPSADFAQTTGIDVANFSAVLNALNLQEQDIQNVQM